MLKLPLAMVTIYIIATVTWIAMANASFEVIGPSTLL